MITDTDRKMITRMLFEVAAPVTSMNIAIMETGLINSDRMMARIRCDNRVRQLPIDVQLQLPAIWKRHD